MAFELLEENRFNIFRGTYSAELFCFSILPPCGSISSGTAPLVGSMILEIILLVIVSSIHIRIFIQKKIRLLKFHRHYNGRADSAYQR